MYGLKSLTSALFCVILFASCATVKMQKFDGGSLIAWAAKTRTGFTSGNGLEIILVNYDTQETYKSERLKTSSPISLIQNLPEGRYIVGSIKMNMGAYKVNNSSSSIIDYFGLIYIKPNKNYYLGNFQGQIKASLKATGAFKIKNVGSDVPQDLVDALKNSESGWEDIDFMPVESVRKGEVTIY